MKRLIPLFVRNIPKISKVLCLTTFFCSQYAYRFANSSIRCISYSKQFSQNIRNIEQQIIRIELNGEIIGYAYCFKHNLLVTTSLDIQETKTSRKTYEFFLGDEKLSGNFKINGNFQNITFIQYTLNTKIKPLPIDLVTQQNSIAPVHILQPREFISIKNGYLVAEDSGYGIVDGTGQIGNLVLKDGKALGIVTQIGKDNQSGLMRIVSFRHLQKILQNIKLGKVHLGISAKTVEDKRGISIIRISPSSPFKNDLMMGDIIVRANGQKVRQPQALQRIFIQNEGKLQLLVIRENEQRLIEVQL